MSVPSKRSLVCWIGCVGGQPARILQVQGAFKGEDMGCGMEGFWYSGADCPPHFLRHFWLKGEGSETEKHWVQL